MEGRKRVSYPLGMFDLVKGFGMIQIVLFHTLSRADVSKWISSVVLFFSVYMMACFFAISGFQFRSWPVKQAVKKYAKMYLPMYFRLAVLVWLCTLVTNTGSFLSYVSAFLLGVFYPRIFGSFYLGGIGLGWFLLGLFWGSVLLNLVLKVKNRYGKIVCVLAAAVLGYVLDTAQIDLFSFYRGLSALPAMYAGYCICTEDLLTRNASGWRRFLPYMLVVLTVPMILWGTNAVWMILLYIIGDMVWGYAAICLSRDTVSCSSILLELIRKIGRYTPRIMIAHGIEMVCFPWDRMAAWLRFVPNEDIKFLILVVFRVVLISMLCVVLSQIDRLENQQKRKKRSRKREQKRQAAGERL